MDRWGSARCLRRALPSLLAGLPSERAERSDWVLGRRERLGGRCAKLTSSFKGRLNWIREWRFRTQRALERLASVQKVCSAETERALWESAAQTLHFDPLLAQESAQVFWALPGLFTQIQKCRHCARSSLLLMIGEGFYHAN